MKPTAPTSSEPKEPSGAQETTKPPPQLEAPPPSSDRLRDAEKLLDYAVSIGAAIPTRVIDTICRSQALGKEMTSESRIAFERAYRDLSRLMHPVTAESLWSTSSEGREGETLPRSKAEEWSRMLWRWTIVNVALILIMVAISSLAGFVPIDEKTDAEIFAEASRVTTLIAAEVDIVMPFLWGALGALTFLLRRCHQTIHARTFDPLRKSEYMNRALLGLISGGVIGLFGDDLLTGELIETIDGATLAFLAGYNTDFLFTALERIFAAVLPKVEAQRAQAVPRPEDRPAAAPTPEETVPDEGEE